MATSLKDKKVKYSISAGQFKEGVCQGDVIMREAKNGPVISGYAILHSDGTIAHVAWWKLVSVIELSSVYNNFVATVEKNSESNSDRASAPVKHPY